MQRDIYVDPDTPLSSVLISHYESIDDHADSEEARSDHHLQAMRYSEENQPLSTGPTPQHLNVERTIDINIVVHTRIEPIRSPNEQRMNEGETEITYEEIGNI